MGRSCSVRLEAQKKLGYYPAHPMAIAELVKHLYPRAPNPEKKFDTINILDPCAGKGEAIKQIADALGVPGSHVYTVELDPERGKAIKELIPDGHHISPATFLGCQITGFSFGLAYVNPPFDNELGGGRREEHAFVQHVTPLLVHKGILVLVCPLHILAGKGTFVRYLSQHYEDVCLYKFPSGKDPEGKTIRGYNEVVVIGRKRRDAIADEEGTLIDMQLGWRSYFQMENIPALGQVQPVSWSEGHPSYDREEGLRTWEIPHSWRPNTFKKSQFTEEELTEALASSPLNVHFDELPPATQMVSPLALDRGHLGLILASGVLDGPVHGPHGTHVVRGSSRKKKYKDEEATESTVNVETGAVSTTEVFRERMITEIRCVVDWPTPEIFTFSNDAKEEKEEHVDGDDEDDDE
jgi:hypothetical protein